MKNEITKNQIEAGMAVRGINYVNVNIVKAYVKDLRAKLASESREPHLKPPSYLLSNCGPH